MTTIFEPRLAISFATVVREGSITAAARVLGVAQPWVSEQVRRLETQIGDRLLIRTSRRMELTETGRVFLPLARALADANEAAQRFAAEAQARSDRELRIGATDFTIGQIERIELINQMSLRHGRLQLQIEGGKPADLVRRLRDGDLDFAMVHIWPDLDMSDLKAIRLGPRYAHVLLPQDDRLAHLNSIPLEALRGRQIVVSPGRSDAPALSAALAPLADYDVQFVPAPDENREAIAMFAARNRLPCFWYYREHHPLHMRGTQLCIPIDDAPLRTEIAVFSRKGDGRSKIQRFRATAQQLAVKLHEPAD